jgi:uncharacterized membrane protein YphA (DoxX/SURF4 family)
MKKFHHFASNAVPLLARILLFLAFVPTGWHHAMNWTEFQGPQADRLRALGVTSALTRNTGEELVRYETIEQSAPADGSAYEPVLHARSLHELTLTFDERGMPKPQIAAWVVSVFELVGGGLLLIGLFSRVWAGGIAFWAIGLFGLFAWHGHSWADLWATNVPSRASMLSLITIATLALGIAFSGAGAFSLDAFIFRRGGAGGGGGGGDEE